MRRREFLGLAGGAIATWSLTARAQQTELPVVGYLNNTSPDDGEPRAAAFRRGLQEAGYEFRYPTLPEALSAELASR